MTAGETHVPAAHHIKMEEKKHGHKTEEPQFTGLYHGVLSPPPKRRCCDGVWAALKLPPALDTPPAVMIKGASHVHVICELPRPMEGKQQ